MVLDGSYGSEVRGHVFSGFGGSGNITGEMMGNDVIHSSCQMRANAYSFDGNLTGASDAADANSTIIKTGSGEQIITGN